MNSRLATSTQGVRSPRLAALSIVALALILTSIPTMVVHGASGDLDATFGNGGRVVSNLGAIDQANAVGIQPDGKIVAVGASTYRGNGNNVFALTRYNPDGTNDNSFGLVGRVLTDLGGSAEAYAFAFQPNGQIVAAGRIFTVEGYFDWVIDRYNSDGSLDTTFGVAGKVIKNFGTFDVATTVAVQADGKILVGGSGDQKLAVVRLDSNGSLDTTFGVGGVVIDEFSGISSASAIVVQPDAKIAVAGGASSDFALLRYNADGRKDESFGVHGTVLTDFGSCPGYGNSSDSAQAMALQRDGKIIVSGVSSDFCRTGFFDFALARYNADGSLDDTFGSAGKVTTDFFTLDDNALSVLVQPDGKIVAGGTTLHIGVGYEFALARYNSNGSPDMTFGTSGKLTTSFGTLYDQAFDMALQSDGKIILAGQTSGNFALARYKGKEFELCLQDDSNGNFLQFNSTTGEYQFTGCPDVTLVGIGTVTKRGSQITLQHTAGDRRILVKVDTSLNRATGSVQILTQGLTFNLSDRIITNNACSCR